MKFPTKIPEKISLNKEKNCLFLEFATKGDSLKFKLSAEYLRVYSPSAAMRDPSTGEQKLLAGKKWVLIADIKHCGNYALKIIFNDGHSSGLYTWQYLCELCHNKEKYWQTYLDRLHQAGACRAPDEQIIKFISH
ncbi:MAG: gamma-butyrobetaine hydroxylase-like domain-containing protein [Endozoicomonadaceae bacterium]|nr:gamma-butyrobetaine hydroxylase-like domain-containing protein [Endozoicomonadaceae bacterium]